MSENFLYYLKKIPFSFVSSQMLWFWVLFLPVFLILLLSGIFKILPFWILFVVLGASFPLLIISEVLFFKSFKRTQKRFYEAKIIEFLADPVVAYDKDFYIVVFNKSAERFFSLKKEEVIGKKITPQKARDLRWQFLCQVVFPSLAPLVKEEEKFEEFETFRIVFDRPFRELKVFFGKILDEKGEVVGFVKVIRDLTRQKLLLKEKTEFLNIAAHNLNTPVSEIRWGLEALEETLSGVLSKEAKDLIFKLKTTSLNLSEIVEDLLNVVRIEEGRFGYHFERVELNQLVKEREERWRPIAERYQVKIFFKKSAEEIYVFCDPSRIKIVLDNLIENALIYNVRNGEIHIETGVLLEKPYALVSVRDTGIGIPADQQEKIFEKFFRARNALKYKTEGIGLGLYIVKNIIKRHGGEIWFDSIENRGTTFYFTLPLKKELIPPKETPLA